MLFFLLATAIFTLAHSTHFALLMSLLMLLLLKFVHPLFVHYQCALSTYDYGFIIGQNIYKIWVN